ncbi:uncharacterized protein LOC144867456 isoform X1 [Branchiostoma floridae x Branchiostoma japonicum]
MSAHTDTRGSAAHTRASAKLDSSSHSSSSATSAKTDTSSCTTAAGMSDKMDASSCTTAAGLSDKMDTSSQSSDAHTMPCHGDQSTRGSGVACSRSISPLTEVENDRPDVLSPAPARIVSFPSETQSLGHIVEEREVGGGEGGSGEGGSGEGGSRRCHSMEEPSPVHMARHQHSSL